MTNFMVIVLVLLVTAVVATMLWLSAYPIVAVAVALVGLVICWVVARA